MTILPFNGSPSTDKVRRAFRASVDLLDAAAILRDAAISMRYSATELERLADEMDPPAEWATPQSTTLGG